MELWPGDRVQTKVGGHGGTLKAFINELQNRNLKQCVLKIVAQIITCSETTACYCGCMLFIAFLVCIEPFSSM